MRFKLAVAAVALAGVVAAPAAHADWHRGGFGPGYGRGYYGHYHRGGFGPGAVVAGALLGLGAAAVIASQPPPVVYAPPPVAYYPPPPAYYAPPAYYPPAYGYPGY